MRSFSAVEPPRGPVWVSVSLPSTVLAAPARYESRAFLGLSPRCAASSPTRLSLNEFLELPLRSLCLLTVRQLSSRAICVTQIILYNQARDACSAYVGARMIRHVPVGSST